jgi:recombination protein RecT
MANENKQVEVVSRLKSLLNVPSVMEQFHNSLGENAGAFTASLVEMLSSDGRLQECSPKDLIMEALKAASLKLPINKNLGFAWIIPRKIKGVLRPQFQIGYRGYYQLAQRTGLYKFINTRTVPAGWKVQEDFKTGEIVFYPPTEPVDGNPVGYFACFVQLNGFSKEIYRSHEWMTKHMKENAPNCHGKDSPWQTDFNGMAEKTIGSHLLSKYGVLSIEYLNINSSDGQSAEVNTGNIEIDQREINLTTGEINESEIEPEIEPEEIKIPAEFA